MKTDQSEVVDPRTAAFEFLKGDTMDNERLCEAMDFINTEHKTLLPMTYAWGCDRVAWHLRKIGEYHLGSAERLENSIRKYPQPNGPEVVRWIRRKAQDCFDTADGWAQGSRDVQAHARRRRLHVVATQLRLPGMGEAAE